MNKASVHVKIKAWAEYFLCINFFEKISKNILTNHKVYAII